MSHSENKPKSTQSSSVNTSNLNVQDVEGVTLAASDNNTINVTDGGAFDFARSSFLDVNDTLRDLGRAAIDSGTDNLNRGLDFAQDAYESSLGFGTDVLESNERVSDKSLDALSQSFGDTLVGLFGFAETAIDKASQNALDLAEQSIAGNQSLAKSTSESADDRVVRLGMYAFLAVGAIFVVQAFAKR